MQLALLEARVPKGQLGLEVCQEIKDILVVMEPPAQMVLLVTLVTQAAKEQRVSQVAKVC